MAKTLITMSGASTWAVINGLWAASTEKGYIPDRVHLLNRVGNDEEGRILVDAMSKYLSSRGKEADIRIIEVDEKDFVSIGKRIVQLIEDEKNQGNEVALDITPGRKAVVSSALLAARHLAADHVFYLYIEDAYMAAKPFLMIPAQIQHPVDLNKEVWV